MAGLNFKYDLMTISDSGLLFWTTLYTVKRCCKSM